MKSRATSIAVAMTAVLAVAIVAQAGDGSVRAGAFEATYGEPADVVDDADTGLQYVIDVPVEATDPRASGLLSLVRSQGGVCSEDQRLNDLAAICLAPLYSVDRNGMRLVNDDGAWVGTRVHFGGDMPDERTRNPRKKGEDEAWSFRQEDLFELVGQGAYDGLAMLGSLDTRGIFGIIVPAASLPDQPEPSMVETPSE